MISIGTKIYVKKKAKKNNVNLSKDWLETLKEYCLCAKDNGYMLSFRKGRFLNSETMDANSGNCIFFDIVVTPEWAYQLVCNPNNETRNAFIMTLGHEITHRKNDINPLRYFGINQKFVAYVNEVHADFGAVNLFANRNRKYQVEAMAYKKKMKNYQRQVDSDNAVHPSWERRSKYIQRYDFDETLIRQIAADVGCTNEKLIQKAINHFEEIYLS